jgi:hypothetical protein
MELSSSIARCSIVPSTSAKKLTKSKKLLLGMRTKTNSLIDPSVMGSEETNQAVVVVATSIFFGGLAIIQGVKPDEPKPCPSCATAGGEACIFCNSTGRRETPVDTSKRELRDDSVLGLTRRSPMECTGCKGAGMILCKTCKGTGYV